jgi:putative serine protease PepD
LTLRPLPLGSSSALAVGDPLAVIGNPFGYNRSLSTGVVSALDRTIQTPNGFTVAHAIQTDAAVNPGNSGGPMLSAQGQVVGIVDQIATGGSNIDSSTGVGFAVPIDVVKAELTQLENGQPVTHAYLGAGTSAPVTQDGAFVESVATGSPAARAGLRPRDVITAVDGTPLIGPNGLVAAVTADKPGTKITLTVLRGSTHLTLTATLGTQPSQAPTG